MFIISGFRRAEVPHGFTGRKPRCWRGRASPALEMIRALPPLFQLLERHSWPRALARPLLEAGSLASPAPSAPAAPSPLWPSLPLPPSQEDAPDCSGPILRVHTDLSASQPPSSLPQTVTSQAPGVRAWPGLGGSCSPPRPARPHFRGLIGCCSRSCRSRRPCSLTKHLMRAAASTEHARQRRRSRGQAAPQFQRRYVLSPNSGILSSL